MAAEGHKSKIGQTLPHKSHFGSSFGSGSSDYNQLPPVLIVIQFFFQFSGNLINNWLLSYSNSRQMASRPQMPPYSTKNSIFFGACPQTTLGKRAIRGYGALSYSHLFFQFLRNFPQSTLYLILWWELQIDVSIIYWFRWSWPFYMPFFDKI